MFREVTSKFDAKAIEAKIQEFWDDTGTYRKARQSRQNGEKFFFVDGPPYTTGRIHLGTAWNKIMKDSILRYKSMNGMRVLDRAGWDMHGLPIEVKVEAELGFRSKKDIEEYGVEEFVSKCKEFAIKNKNEMTQQFKRLGVWLDWDDPYMTLRNEYIEAAWWTLKKAQEKNLLEKGRRVVNWCPRCETAIADSEVEYWDESDPSIYVKFPVEGESDTYIVIWTTTPWTIPANIAVAVNPSFEYSRIKAVKDGKEEILIIASQLAEDVLKKGRYQDYEVAGTLSGEEVTRLTYRHPLSEKIPKQVAFPHGVYAADFVSGENTGCVHIAPGHGVEDFELGVRHNLTVFCPVGPDGRYTDEAGEYAHMHVREANQRVQDDLRDAGLLLASGKITHRYGHCWRCKTPIIYLATEQWFLRVTELKDAMLSEIDSVSWFPDWAGSARFRDWVTGARDWCISRQRYWGIPIPVWVCEQCGGREVIGTMAELKERSGEAEIKDLHRPDVDNIKITCDCGGTMRRVEDVFDVWFDSAVASWATLKYPREAGAFEELWPADFITEGHDQTRGWFYSQLGASMIAFGRAPYRSVLMHGFTLDEKGEKMSKSLGNVVAPEEVIEKYGADTLRLYTLSSSAPWDDLKFSWSEAENDYRMLNILWNVYRFPLPYMILDRFDPSRVPLESVRGSLRVEDRWILSRLNSLINSVDESMRTYMLHRAVRAISDFVLEDLSRWYVQLVRPRTWIEADDPDKLAAYRVMYDVLVTLSKLLAPFAPYISECMYRNLAAELEGHESVHFCDWVRADASLIDTRLEARMSTIREITEAASNARQKSKRKLRWPVRRIVIAPKSEDTGDAVRKLETVLMEQTNAKSIVVLGAGEAWDELSCEIIPNFTALGPVFKKDAGKVAAALKEMDGKELKCALSGGSATLATKAGEITITSDMVSFKDSMPKDIAAAEFPDGAVYVDTSVTDDIEAEGYAREVLRRLQEMRKEMDLEVDMEVAAYVLVKDQRVAGLLSGWKEFIGHEARACMFTLDSDIHVEGELVKDWDVEGVEMRMGLKRAAGD